MHSLDQVTDQFIHVKTHSLHIGFYDARTVSEWLGDAGLLILSIASSLCVGLAFVLEYNLLDHVTVGVLVDTVTTNIILAYIRMISLDRSWCGVSQVNST